MAQVPAAPSPRRFGDGRDFLSVDGAGRWRGVVVGSGANVRRRAPALVRVVLYRGRPRHAAFDSTLFDLLRPAEHRHSFERLRCRGTRSRSEPVSYTHLT